MYRGNVEVVIDQKDQRNVKATLLKQLELEQVLDRDVEHLSGVYNLTAIDCYSNTLLMLHCLLCWLRNMRALSAT